jgi:nitrogen fixation protein NifB
MASSNPVSPARVAIASRDGGLIDECFGRAGFYLIYEADGSGYRLREQRPGPRPCRGSGPESAPGSGQDHDHQALAAAVALLADCDLVLAGRIGPEALRLLDKNGIAGFAVHISIAEALRKLARRAR